MEKEVKLGYNPEITLDVVSDILGRRFPEYEQSRQSWSVQGAFIRLKKSMFVHACIFVKHNQKKNRTVIGINGHMSILAIVCFGFILHYLLRGNFLSEVESAIEEEIDS